MDFKRTFDGHELMHVYRHFFCWILDQSVETLIEFGFCAYFNLLGLESLAAEHEVDFELAFGNGVYGQLVGEGLSAFHGNLQNPLIIEITFFDFMSGITVIHFVMTLVL